MDLERLDEALAFWDKGAKIHGGYPSDMATIIDAARAYRDLANGERMDVDALIGEVGLRLFHVVGVVIDAAIGDKLLIDPPVEEEA